MFPVTKWANVELVNLQARYCSRNSSRGLVLLELAKIPTTVKNLYSEVFRLFGVDNFRLVNSDGKEIGDSELLSLSGRTIFVVPCNKNVVLPKETVAPFCEVRNFVERNTEGTIILENPEGNRTFFSELDYKSIVYEWTKMPKTSQI